MPADGRRFIDTSVVLYAFGAAGGKADRASEVLGTGGIVSVQVLNETASVLKRKAGRDWAEIEDILGVLRGLLTVVPLTEAVHCRGVSVARATGYSVWDAMVVGAALEAAAEELLSEDMQDGRRIEGLVIRNPFNSL